jgi:hypothetical protein
MTRTLCLVLVCLMATTATPQSASRGKHDAKSLVKYLAEALYGEHGEGVYPIVEALLPHRGDAVLAICDYARDLDRARTRPEIKDLRLTMLSIGLKKLIASNPSFLRTLSESSSENLKVLVALTAGHVPKPEWGVLEALSKDGSKRVREIAIYQLGGRR